VKWGRAALKLLTRRSSKTKKRRSRLPISKYRGGNDYDHPTFKKTKKKLQKKKWGQGIQWETKKNKGLQKTT